MNIEQLRTVDLFAGIGGIRIGFEHEGFKTVFANDSDPKCALTYNLNFPTTPLTVKKLDEVTLEEIPDFEVLLGGFPCQPFSIAGYRKGFLDEGRGELFFEITRILHHKKPPIILLENVKNLRGHDKGKTYRIIESSLKELGYNVKSKVLNSMEYGNIPQNRERIYIVGFLDEKYYHNFSFPEPIRLTVSVTDLLEKQVDPKYYYNDKPLYDHIKDDVTDKGVVYQWRRKYVRQNKKGVCPTLTANMGMGGHNVPIIRDDFGIRRLTPLECARIQGYDMNHYTLPKIADSHLYKQIGNSVSVPVLKRIAHQIKEAIRVQTL